MANIYDMNAAIKQPNFVGNFNQGMQAGQQQQQRAQMIQQNQGKLQAQQQQAQDQQQVSALAPQIIAGDPTATNQAAAINPAMAAKYAPAAAQNLQRMVGAMNYIDSQKTPQAKEAAYQATRPFLDQFGPSQPTFAEAEPAMEQFRAKVASMEGAQPHKYMNVGQGATVFDQNTGKPAYTNPAAEKAPHVIAVNLPDGSTQQYTQNPDGTLAPLKLAPVAGQPGAATPQSSQPVAAGGPQDSMNAILAQANLKAQQGMPDAQVQAFIHQAAQDAGIQMTAPGTQGSQPQAANPEAAPQGQPAPQPQAATDMGQLGRSAPKPIGGGSSLLSSVEVKKIGLPVGTIAQRDAHGKISILSKGDSGFNANLPQELGDASLSGKAYLESIPESDRATVLSVLQGRQAPPSGTAQKSSYWMGIINAANKIDPTFDTTDYQKRYKTAQEFAPSGVTGKQIMALNTMIQHVGELKNAYDALNNGSSPIWNGIANKVAYDTGLGSHGLNTYNLNARTAAQEIESLWKKGSGNASDIEAMQKDLSSSADPQSANKAFAKMLQLAAGKLQAMHASYQNAMGNSNVPLQLVTPDSLATMKRIDPAMAATYEQNASAQPSGQLAGDNNPTMPKASGGWSIQKVQ